MLDYETLKVIWWLLVGVLLVGFAIMDGHDMGVGTLLPFVGRDDDGAPRHHQHRRPALGRQPGLVHHRRRRHLRRLAAGLRHGVLRLLLGDAGGAVGAVLPPGRLRLPQQDRRSALAQHLGLGPVRRRRGAAADLRRRLRQPAAGRAVPLRQPHGLVLHGLVLGTAESVRAAGRRGIDGDDHVPRRDLPRASHRGRNPAARERRRTDVRDAAVASPSLRAGVWLASAIAGYVIKSAVDPAALPNPLAKTVVRERRRMARQLRDATPARSLLPVRRWSARCWRCCWSRAG